VRVGVPGAAGPGALGRRIINEPPGMPPPPRTVWPVDCDMGRQQPRKRPGACGPGPNPPLEEVEETIGGRQALVAFTYHAAQSITAMLQRNMLEAEDSRRI